MNKIPVLAYHGVSEKIPGQKENKYNITLDTFVKQIKLLFDSEYRTASLENILPGKEVSTSTAKEIVITFDDGHGSNFTKVLPVLEKYGYKAIFFVTSGLIGKDVDSMDWKQVDELCKRGHDVQSHGHTHRFLNQLSCEQIRSELEQSGELIYSHTDKKPLFFSCPGGRFDARVVEIAKTIGYQKMFISCPGYLDNDDSSRSFLVDRWMITTDMTMYGFIKILESDELFLAKSKMKYFLKNGLKALLGENRYHNLSKGIING